MGFGNTGATPPPGFRFYPSDEELVSHYLYKKITNEGVLKGTLVEIDFHTCEPWQLPVILKRYKDAKRCKHRMKKQNNLAGPAASVPVSAVTSTKPKEEYREEKSVGLTSWPKHLSSQRPRHTKPISTLPRDAG